MFRRLAAAALLSLALASPAFAGAGVVRPMELQEKGWGYIRP